MYRGLYSFFNTAPSTRVQNLASKDINNKLESLETFYTKIVKPQVSLTGLFRNNKERYIERMEETATTPTSAPTEAETKTTTTSKSAEAAKLPDKFKLGGVDYEGLGPKNADEQLRNFFGMFMMLLGDLKQKKLVTVEEFFNSFIEYMNNIYKEYGFELFDTYDKEIDTLRFKATYGTTIKQTHLTQLSMALSAAGEDYAKKSFSDYFKDWFDQWWIENVYTDVDTSLCLKLMYHIYNFSNLFDGTFMEGYYEKYPKISESLKKLLNYKLIDAQVYLDSINGPLEMKKAKYEEFKKLYNDTKKQLEIREPAVENRKVKIKEEKERLEKALESMSDANKILDTQNQIFTLDGEREALNMEIKDLESTIDNAKTNMDNMSKIINGQGGSLESMENNLEVIKLLTEANEKIAKLVEELLQYDIFKLHNYLINIEDVMTGGGGEDAANAKLELQKWAEDLIKDDRNYYFDQYGVLLLPYDIRILLETGDISGHDFVPEKMKYISEVEITDTFRWDKNGDDVINKVYEILQIYVEYYTKIVNLIYFSDENKENMPFKYEFTDLNKYLEKIDEEYEKNCGEESDMGKAEKSERAILRGEEERIKVTSGIAVENEDASSTGTPETPSETPKTSSPETPPSEPQPDVIENPGPTLVSDPPAPKTPSTPAPEPEPESSNTTMIIIIVVVVVIVVIGIGVGIFLVMRSKKKKHHDNEEGYEGMDGEQNYDEGSENQGYDDDNENQNYDDTTDNYNENQGYDNQNYDANDNSENDYNGNYTDDNNDNYTDTQQQQTIQT